MFDESPWCEFTALVDALEDFAAHLVDAAWKHIDALHPAAADLTDGRSGRVPYHLVISAWTRGLRHANPTGPRKDPRDVSREGVGCCVRTRTWCASWTFPTASDSRLTRSSARRPRRRTATRRSKTFSAYTSGAMIRETRAGRCLESWRWWRRAGAPRRRTRRGWTSGRPSSNTRLGRAKALGDAWYYTRDTEIRYVLDTLGDCAVALLSVSRGVDPATLANRAESRVRRRANPRAVRLRGGALDDKHEGRKTHLQLCPAPFTGRTERDHRRRRARVDGRARSSRRVAEGGFG